ncbi:MAG: phosphatase PAP2 family protein [Solirubrobacteraceae bacterium]
MVRVRALQARLLPHGWFDLLRQVLLFFLAYNGYRLVRGIADDPGVTAAAFDHARTLINAEQSLGLFAEPAIQAWSNGTHFLQDVASWLYINAQTSVTVGSLAFLYLFHNRSFYFVRNMFMVAMGIALVGYTVFPTAPPRFFPEWGFEDSVSNFVGVTHDSSVNALFNPYAAVPSMHVCFALMIGIPLSRLVKNRAGQIFWRIYPLLVVFVIVATGNHFFADAFFGAITAGVSAYAASWLARARPAVWTFSRSGAPA